RQRLQIHLPAIAVGARRRRRDDGPSQERDDQHVSTDHAGIGSSVRVIARASGCRSTTRRICRRTTTDAANVTQPVNVCHPPEAATRPHISQAMPVAAMRNPFITIAIGTAAATSVVRLQARPYTVHATSTATPVSETSDRSPLQASAT